MSSRTMLSALCASLLVFAFAAPASAQTMKSVAGTYQVVKVSAYGDNARGMMTLSPDGHYSIVLARATLPKFAADSRTKGTAEENSAVVGGSIAHFGKYTIDDGGKAITFHIVACTFPNWDGTTVKRALKVSGDQLTYTVTAPSAGGPANDVVWKRMK
jgi:hypothetical protein